MSSVSHAVRLLQVELNLLNAKIVKCYGRATGKDTPQCDCLTVAGCRSRRHDNAEKRDSVVDALQLLRGT